MSEPTAATGTPVPSLRRNFSWTLAGNIGYAACQWGMLVVLAKLLTPADVGQFALALALTAPPILFASLKLRSAVATDARWEYRFDEYMALRVATTLVVVAILAVIGFAGYDRPTAWVILVVAVTKGVDAVSDLLQGLFQHAERHDRIAVGMLLNGGVSLVAMTAAVWWTRSVLAGAVASLAGSTAALIAFNLPEARRLRPAGTPLLARATPARLRALTLLTWPLAVNTSLGSLSTNVPRYFLEHASGRGALGIYSALAYLLVAGSLVINALGQAATPRMARAWQAGDVARFRRLTVRLVGSGAVLGAAGIVVSAVAGPWVLRILYRPEYATHADVLVLLAVAAAVTYGYVFLGTALSAMRRFKVQMPISLAGFAVLLVAAWRWVPSHGMAGAAWALIAGGAAQAVLFAMIVIPALRAGRPQSLEGA